MSFYISSSVTPDHRVWWKWNMRHQNSWLGKTRETQLDSTLLVLRTAATAVVSKPQSQCRVFVSLTGLHWTRLDSAGVYAPLAGAILKKLNVVYLSSFFLLIKYSDGSSFRHKNIPLHIYYKIKQKLHLSVLRVPQFSDWNLRYVDQRYPYRIGDHVLHSFTFPFAIKFLRLRHTSSHQTSTR